jgi:hypothetical protein
MRVRLRLLTLGECHSKLPKPAAAALQRGRARRHAVKHEAMRASLPEREERA